MSNTDDPIDEPTGRLATAVNKVVSYHVEEYDLTAATVIGVLFLETLRRAMQAMEPDEDAEAE